MKYYAYLKQCSGCDYTIGCGVKLVELRATSAVEAGLELYNMVMNDYSGYETKLDSAVLIESTAVIDYDVSGIYKVIEAKKEQAKIAAKEQQEKELYNKLKLKFEK